MALLKFKATAFVPKVCIMEMLRWTLRDAGDEAFELHPLFAFEN